MLELAGRDVYLTIVELHRAWPGADDDLCAQAARAYARLRDLAVRAEAGSPDFDAALEQLLELGSLLSRTVAWAADRCSAAADALAVFEEHADAPATDDWMSAVSVAALCRRLREAA